MCVAAHNSSVFASFGQRSSSLRKMASSRSLKSTVCVMFLRLHILLLPGDTFSTYIYVLDEQGMHVVDLAPLARLVQLVEPPLDLHNLVVAPALVDADQVASTLIHDLPLVAAQAAALTRARGLS